MERVPFAMRAMAKAAVDAGLIDGSKTAQEREAALFKLMEQGKLISGTVLPYFGKAMSELANNNDELAKALRENLSPAVGRASNQLVELQKQMFDGMKPSVMFALDSFNDLSKESGNAAYFTGTVLGGALLGLTTIIRLPVAALTDLAYWISDVTGLSDESTKSLLTWTGTVIGAAAGVWVLVKSVKALATAYKVAKRAADAMKTLTGKAPTTAATTAASTGTRGVVSTAARGALRQSGKLLGPLGVLLSGYEGGTSLYDRLSTTNERNANVMQWLKERGKLQIDINVNPNGLDDVIEAKVEKSNGDMLEGAAMNLSSGSIK